MTISPIDQAALFRQQSGAKVALAMLVGLTTGSAAWSAGTAAGTAIDNTAVVNFDLSGVNISQSSNTVRLIVEERIDVAVTSQKEPFLSVVSAPYRQCDVTLQSASGRVWISS